MTNKRKQHLVPRASLKKFGYKKYKDNKLLVFDKVVDKVYEANIEDVACKCDFYEVSTKSKNYWENWYNDIENNINSVINSIIINCRFAPTRFKVLSSYLKEELALIILTQITRTNIAKKYFHNISKSVCEKSINQTKMQLGGLLTQENIKVLNNYYDNEDFIFSNHLEFFNSKQFLFKAKNILLERTWIIHKNINYNTCPFATSDNPVLLYNYLTRKNGFGHNGLSNNHTIIYYPINHELILGIYPNIASLIKLRDVVDYIDDNKFVRNYNASILEQCDRQIFI